MQNLPKERKQPTVVRLQQAFFVQYIYFKFVAKNHQKIR